MAEDQALALLLTDLRQAGAEYEVADRVLFSRAFRWPHALPYFDVGHIRRLSKFAGGEIETGRVVFAGDYLGGPFIEGAVTSGQAAARRLLESFQRHERAGR
jgi:oxygen-dependent protoporphyrinogen oxidase